MAASWLGPIGVLTVLWAAVSLRMKLAWRLPVWVRMRAPASAAARAGRRPDG